MSGKADSLTKFGKLAGPQGQCLATALAKELHVETKDFLTLQTKDGMIRRDQFLAWLLCKQFGDQSIHGDALLLRSTSLKSTPHAPAVTEVWPGNRPIATTVKITKAAARILQQVVASFATSSTPHVRASAHFAKVAEFGFDANLVPFPHSAFRTGFPKPVPKLTDVADLEKRDVNDRPFPTPGGKRATVAHSEGENESVNAWIQGRATEAAELRKEIHAETTAVDTVAVPWPMVDFSVKNDDIICKDASKGKVPKPRWRFEASAAAKDPDFLTGHHYLRAKILDGAVNFNVDGEAWTPPKEGIIAKDILTNKQANVEASRHKKGAMTDKAISRRRIKLGKFFVREKFGSPAAALNAQFFIEIMPTLEKDAALSKFRTRLSEERTGATDLFEARAAEGARITAWLKEGSGCWPSPGRVWESFCRRFASKRAAAPKLTKKIRSLRKPKELVKPQRKAQKSLTKAANTETKVEEDSVKKNIYGGDAEDASTKPSIVAFADLLELKTYICPPMEVVKVIDIVMILLAGLDPKLNSGSTADLTWKVAKRFLASPIKLVHQFDRTLKPFNSGAVPAGSIEQARTSQLELIKVCSITKMRTKSSAAANVCAWTAGVFHYYDLCKKGAAVVRSVAATTESLSNRISNPFGPPPALKAPVPHEASSALQAAAKALASLDKTSLLQVRTLTNPPQSIATVAHSILILLAGINSGVPSADAKKEISWLSMRKVMTNPEKFVSSLKKLHAEIEANQVPSTNVERAFAAQRVLGREIDPAVIKRQFKPMMHLGSWLANVLKYYQHAATPATNLFAPPPRTITAAKIVDQIITKKANTKTLLDTAHTKQLSTPARSARAIK